MTWDLVITSNQNNRDLYQSAVRLFASRPPDAAFSEPCHHKIYRVKLWDTAGLPFTADSPVPVRVVRSEEVLDRNRYRERKLTSQSTDHEWLWILTLSAQIFPLSWSAGWGKTAGRMSTTAGWISPNTGLSSTASCMRAAIAPNRWTLPASVWRFPIGDCRP